MTEKVPASVAIRNEYLRIAAVQNINQCSGLYCLSILISELKQKQDALKTVLNEIYIILNNYNNQRIKLAEAVTGFPIPNKLQ